VDAQEIASLRTMMECEARRTEARIYHWNQFADRLIGIDGIPPELRARQVIGPEWVRPTDPRRELAMPRMAAE